MDECPPEDLVGWLPEWDVIFRKVPAVFEKLVEASR